MTGRNREFREEFKREAVRLSLESGRTIPQVAKDLGIGKSTLNTWRRQFRDAGLHNSVDGDLEKENARLRRENEVLRQERDLLKKATALFAKEPSR